MIETESIAQMAQDVELAKQTRALFNRLCEHKYSYHFDWLGRPIIQFPQDIMAMQELIWQVQPDLIIETGIAHGGSLIFHASMLVLLDVCEAIASGKTYDLHRSARKVIGIDIDIRAHNRVAIEAHPLASLIQMIQGSSITPETIEKVHREATGFNRVMVCLDSNHTHEHVLAELQAYASLTSLNSYCVVFDTVIEDMPKALFPSRPWGPGNNPKTAIQTYLETHAEFQIDRMIPDKLVMTVAPDGFLKRVR